MRKILTQESIDYLTSQCISFSENRQTPRINPGDVVQFREDARVDKVTGFHLKRWTRSNDINIHDIGYMSYSGSNLPLDTKVGRYSSIAANTQFIGFNHPVTAISTHPFVYSRMEGFDLNYLSAVHAQKESLDSSRLLVPCPQKGGLTVGHDVWIGSNCVFSGGIHLATGSVIAAHSLVTKSTEPYSIVGGNPAKLIRKRFPEEIIEGLLCSEWWNYHYLDFADLPIGQPDIFLKYFMPRRSNIERYNPGFLDLSALP